MLATLAEDLPAEKTWLFEVKWDGYRTIAYLRGGDVKLRSRRDQDQNERFADVVRALPGAIRTPNCVLDGEVCALDENGRASFSAMQRGDGTLVYYVFDVLEADGEPLIDLPFTKRRERLEALLDRVEPRRADLGHVRGRDPRSCAPCASSASKASSRSSRARATSPASGATPGARSSRPSARSS